MNEKVLGDTTLRTAGVTESRVARGIVTALSWINVGLPPFAAEPAR